MSSVFERMQQKKAENEKAEQPLNAFARAQKISEEKKKEGEKPRLEIVPPVEVEKADSLPENKPEIIENTGQPVDQNAVSQLATDSNQSAGQLVSQSASQPDDQSAIYNKYPSRRLRKQKGLRLPAHKLEKWEFWCFINKVDFQDAVEEALDWLTSQPVSHIRLDDLDDEKETDEVIIFYRKWTGNKIRPKDREERKNVLQYSTEICQIGIIRSVLKAASKVGSFAYCVPVIEQVFEELEAGGVKDFKGYLEYSIKKLLETKKK